MTHRALFRAPDAPESWFLSFDEAIDAMLGRDVVLPDEFYDELQGEARAKAFSIAGIDEVDMLQGVLDSLGDALKNGGTFDDWKKEVVKLGKEGLQLPEYRLANVYRTNIQTAYSAGRWKQMVANADNRPWLLYDAVGDSRTRPTHMELDGTIARITSAFWRTHMTPNGYMCRCGAVPLDDDEAEALGGPTMDIPDVQPDPGWDYNPGEARWRGIEKAYEQRTQEIDPALKGKLTQFKPPSA